MADDSAQAPHRRRRGDGSDVDLAIQLAVLAANHQALERRVDGITTDGDGIKERLLAVELGQKQMGTDLHGFIEANTPAMTHQTRMLEGLDKGLDRVANELMRAHAKDLAIEAILTQQQTIIDEWRTERAEAKEAARLADEAFKTERLDSARRTREILKALAGLVAAAIVALVGILASPIAAAAQRGTIQGFTIVIVGLVAAYVLLKWLSTRRP